MGASHMSGPLIVDAGIKEGASGLVRKTYVAPLIAATATTGGSQGSFANPEGARVLITRVILDITTEATGAATADVGVAVNGTTSSDTLFDGVNIGAAAGVFDNIENQGTNGGSVRAWGATQFVTVTASASAAGLVGNIIIEYLIP